jgi:phosphate transport system protein
MVTEHSYKEYDLELEAVKAQVLKMGGLVEENIVYAIESLKKDDVELANKVIKTDDEVNKLEMEIDEAASLIIAKRQPAAGDLRMIIMILKAITDLERIGDEATKIARTTIRVNENPNIKKIKIGEIKLMVEAVHSMLKTVLDSFARFDISETIEIAKKDEAVDSQYRATIRELLTYMLEDSKAISVSLELLVVTKALERIGDHCKNISEHIVYGVKGADIRHSTIKEIKKTLAE